MENDMGTVMDVDGDSDDSTSSISSTEDRAEQVVIKPKRKPSSNIRHEDRENRMTRLKKNGHIHYSEDIILGLGATSIVYRGYYQYPEKPAAIKRVLGEFVHVSKTEVDIWKLIGTTVSAANVNVVQLFECRQFNEGNDLNFYFAMELAKDNLETIVTKMHKDHDPLWKQKSIGYLEDGAKGLNWLHEKRVIHRDVKPQNFLVYDVNGKEVCKICDFGISKKLSEMSTGTNSMGQGTSDWMAPEALKSRNFQTPINTRRSLDIFSFGMTAFFVMSQGVHPFHKSERFGIDKAQNIMSDEVQPFRLKRRSKGDAADHLFSWAMSKVANLRPKIDQVLLHPFFWTSTRKLEFIVDFAKCMDNRKDPHVTDLWNRIDQSYQNYRRRKFDWRGKIDQKVIDCLFKKTVGKKGMQLKQYNGKSLMDMVFLLRDKDMHYTGIDRDLICENYFGELYDVGHYYFSKDKFINYFLKFYPDFIIFIFVFLVKDQRSQKHSFLKTMRQNHKLNFFPSGMKNM